MNKKVFEIGSEYDWESNTSFLVKENDFFFNVKKQNIRFLRSGRDAIRYVARLCKDKCKTALMPALMCACVPQQFVEEGYQVTYYKVNKDFTADIEDIKGKISSDTIFFYMNYFGMPFISDKQLTEIRSGYSNLIFVEDITHDFLKRRTECFVSDFTVCSIRKWFAIPDGGMVIGKEKLDLIPVEKNDYFAELRKNAMKQKNVYFNTGMISDKDAYRTTLANANEYIDHIDNIAEMQEESIKILEQIDLKKIYELRVRNVKILERGIRTIDKIETLVPRCEDSTLYYPIHVKNSQKVIQKKMAERAFYLPVIWPVPQDAEGICGVADEVADSMLAVPCDHRYTVDDMEKIIEALKECVQ